MKRISYFFAFSVFYFVFFGCFLFFSKTSKCFVVINVFKVSYCILTKKMSAKSLFLTDLYIKQFAFDFADFADLNTYFFSFFLRFKKNVFLCVFKYSLVQRFVYTFDAVCSQTASKVYTIRWTKLYF